MPTTLARALHVLTLGTTLALPLAAQEAAPAKKAPAAKPTLETAATPKECGQAVSSAWMARSAAWDSLSKGKTPAPTKEERQAYYKASDSARVADAVRCAGKFDLATIDATLLPDLATLYKTGKRTDLAVKAMERYVQVAAPADRPAAISEAIGQVLPSYSDTAPDRLALAERYMAQLDRLGADADRAKLLAHAHFGGVYGFGWAKSADKLRAHGERIVALAQGLRYDAITSKADSSQVARAIYDGYDMLATVRLFQDDFAKAVEAYQQGGAAVAAHFPDTSAYSPVGRSRTEVKRYGLVGKPAPVITAGYWINAPDGQRDTLDFRNKITLLEFTTNW